MLHVSWPAVYYGSKFSKLCAHDEPRNLECSKRYRRYYAMWVEPKDKVFQNTESYAFSDSDLSLGFAQSVICKNRKFVASVHHALCFTGATLTEIDVYVA